MIFCVVTQYLTSRHIHTRSHDSWHEMENDVTLLIKQGVDASPAPFARVDCWKIVEYLENSEQQCFFIVHKIEGRLLLMILYAFTVRQRRLAL